MPSPTILILGGYGGTGKVVSRMLLQEADAHIIIAGRRLSKAQELADQLSQEFPNKHVSARYADASDYQSLLNAFQGVSLVLVASTTTQYVKQVVGAALEAGSDYLDYHFSPSIIPVLNSLAPAIAEAGRVFITQAGFHPGLPATFVRYAAPHFDRFQKAIVGMAMNARVEQAESVYELIDELADYKTDIFKDGKWKSGGYRDVLKLDFGPRFGLRSCYPMGMEEIRPLPQMYALREVGVYVAGFNWFVDYLVFPLGAALSKIKKGLGRHLLARLMVWGLNRFSPPEAGVVFVLEAEGKRGGSSVKVRITAEHPDGYYFTAAPVVACVLQYMGGSIIKPGLWMMGHIVDPVRLLGDMERMGIEIKTQISSSSGG